MLKKLKNYILAHEAEKKESQPFDQNPLVSSSKKKYFFFVLGSMGILSLCGFLFLPTMPQPRHPLGISGLIAHEPTRAVLQTEDKDTDTNTTLKQDVSSEPYYSTNATTGLASLTPSRILHGSKANKNTPALQSIILLQEGKVHLITTKNTTELARLRETATLDETSAHVAFATDMFSLTSEYSREAALLYGEVVDENGEPMRWRNSISYLSDDLQACPRSKDFLAKSIGKLVKQMRFIFDASSGSKGYAPYMQTIGLYAQKYNISKALIVAIMHTESNFYPRAVSHSNALGLMQVVPTTAGEEVHHYLTGTRAIPSMHTLFTPEQNIKYGATYLHLLNRVYFGGIVNPVSRKLCIIAAYNGGPGAVQRIFDPNMSKALAKINSLTSDEVFTILQSKLPSTETREYVTKVLNRYKEYMTFL